MCRKKDGLTQEQRVLNYIKEFGVITSYEAFVDLGVTRLAAKIFNLRKQGYPVTSRTIPVQNRWGETCHVSQYYLEKENKEND